MKTFEFAGLYKHYHENDAAQRIQTNSCDISTYTLKRKNTVAIHRNVNHTQLIC